MSKQSTAHFVTDALVRKLIPVSLRYAVAHSRYTRANPPYLESTDPRAQAAIDGVRRDGIYIWNNYIPRDVAIGLGEKAYPHLLAVKDGTSVIPNRTLVDAECGVYRIMDAHTILPEAKSLFQDDVLFDVAKAVTTRNVRSHQHMIELRAGIRDACSEDCWHFDEPFKHKFKFFLLLTDVDENNAPFSYVKKSHIGGAWRRKKERDAYHFGTTGDWGFLHQHEYAGLKRRWGKQLDWQPVKCTGAAGTLILFNANGLHRRELLRSGHRIVLSTYYEA